MKVLGLIVVLMTSVGLGVIYMQSRSWDSQGLPESYRVLQDLETKGLYSGEDLLLKDLGGKEIRLSSLKGQVVILSFWATWCEPCVEEFPSFIKLLDTFPKKIKLIAISHDSKPKDVLEFVSAFKGFRDNMILTMDEDKKMSEAFGVDRLPEGFVFDKQGKLVKKIIGIQDWATPDAIEFFKRM